MSKTEQKDMKKVHYATRRLAAMLMALPLALTATAYSGTHIYNGDGIGHGAPVPPNYLSDQVKLTGYGTAGDPTQWPSGFTKGNSAFAAGIYDGNGDVWMVPAGADRVVRINTATGVMTRLTNAWPSGITATQANKFTAGALDGNGFIWLAPSSADRVVRINTATGAMSGFAGWSAAGVTKNATVTFTGAVYDGNGSIWLVPGLGSRVVRVNTANGTMTGYTGAPSGGGSASYNGGVYDGNGYIWMIPSAANAVCRVDTSTGAMTAFNGWPAGLVRGSNASFHGGVYDGRGHVWMIPRNADSVVKIDTSTGAMTRYADWPVGFTKATNAFMGGAFDGRYIWMAPYAASHIVRVDTLDGSMAAYNQWAEMPGFSKGSADFMGGAFDGRNVWMVPWTADRVVSINPLWWLTLGTAAWEAAVSGEETSVAVTSNVNWTVSSSDDTWLTFSPASGSGNGALAITAAANTGAARSGTITVTNGELTRTVEVTQDAFDDPVDPTDPIERAMIDSVTVSSNNVTLKGSSENKGGHYAIFAATNLLDSAWVFVPYGTDYDGILESDGSFTAIFPKNGDQQFYRVLTSTTEFADGVSSSEEAFSFNVGGFYTVQLPAGPAPEYVANQLEQKIQRVNPLFNALPSGSRVLIIDGGISRTATKTGPTMWSGTTTVDIPRGKEVQVILPTGVDSMPLVISGTLEPNDPKTKSAFGDREESFTCSTLPLLGNPQYLGVTTVASGDRCGQMINGNLSNRTFTGTLWSPAANIKVGEGFVLRVTTAQSWTQELVIPDDRFELSILKY